MARDTPVIQQTQWEQHAMRIVGATSFPTEKRDCSSAMLWLFPLSLALLIFHAIKRITGNLSASSRPAPSLHERRHPWSAARVSLVRRLILLSRLHFPLHPRCLPQSPLAKEVAVASERLSSEPQQHTRARSSFPLDLLQSKLLSRVHERWDSRD